MFGAGPVRVAREHVGQVGIEDRQQTGQRVQHGCTQRADIIPAVAVSEQIRRAREHDIRGAREHDIRGEGVALSGHRQYEFRYAEEEECIEEYIPILHFLLSFFDSSVCREKIDTGQEHGIHIFTQSM